MDAKAPASRLAPTLNVYEDYGWLRGFSVVPSWSARIETAWLKYDGARMREEIAPARLFHANCIRLWIEYTAWIEDPELVTANFLDAVAAIDEAGMKVMPCLFNTAIASSAAKPLAMPPRSSSIPDFSNLTV